MVATRVVAKYFAPQSRGNNLTKKLSKYVARDFQELPERTQSYIKYLAFDDAPKVDGLCAEPSEYDEKTTIFVNKHMKNNAINWCIENNKLQYIESVKTLCSRSSWTVYYKESTFRYFTIWPVNISGMPGALRGMLINGDAVDLQNAIGQFIISEFGEKLLKYPEVHTYLTNPKAFRENLAKKHNIDEEKIKRILHALLLGARTNKNSMERGYGAINKINPCSINKNIELIDSISVFIEQLKTVKKKIASSNKNFAIRYFEWEQAAIKQVYHAINSNKDMSSIRALIIHDGIEGINLKAASLNTQFTSILYGPVFKFKVTQCVNGVIENKKDEMDSSFNDVLND